MAKITAMQFPQGTANDLLLRVLPFEMDAKAAQFYYELREVIEPMEKTEESEAIEGSIKVLTIGNLYMTEEEFAGWGQDNQYCLDWAASKLNVELSEDI